MEPSSTSDPLDSVRLARALSLCSEACFIIALQRRRLKTDEPEDATFTMRRWADWQYLIVTLRRLRQAAQIAGFNPGIGTAILDFDTRLPGLLIMRNVGEHVEDYSVGLGRDQSICRQQLQVGLFGCDELEWLGHRLDADEAVFAADALFTAVQEASNKDGRSFG